MSLPKSIALGLGVRTDVPWIADILDRARAEGRSAFGRQLRPKSGAPSLMS